MVDFTIKGTQTYMYTFLGSTFYIQISYNFAFHSVPTKMYTNLLGPLVMKQFIKLSFLLKTTFLFFGVLVNMSIAVPIHTLKPRYINPINNKIPSIKNLILVPSVRSWFYSTLQQ